MNIAENITQTLSYFDELDRISSRLNTPTLSVTSDTFSSTLARLDECIIFVEHNVSGLLKFYDLHLSVLSSEFCFIVYLYCSNLISCTFTYIYVCTL